MIKKVYKSFPNLLSYLPTQVKLTKDEIKNFNHLLPLKLLHLTEGGDS